jgi:hypothetical protein
LRYVIVIHRKIVFFFGSNWRREWLDWFRLDYFPWTLGDFDISSNVRPSSIVLSVAGLNCARWSTTSVHGSLPLLPVYVGRLVELMAEE